MRACQNHVYTVSVSRKIYSVRLYTLGRGGNLHISHKLFSCAVYWTYFCVFFRHLYIIRLYVCFCPTFQFYKNNIYERLLMTVIKLNIRIKLLFQFLLLFIKWLSLSSLLLLIQGIRSAYNGRFLFVFLFFINVLYQTNEWSPLFHSLFIYTFLSEVLTTANYNFTLYSLYFI